MSYPRGAPRLLLFFAILCTNATIASTPYSVVMADDVGISSWWPMPSPATQTQNEISIPIKIILFGEFENIFAIADGAMSAFDISNDPNIREPSTINRHCRNIWVASILSILGFLTAPKSLLIAFSKISL